MMSMLGELKDARAQLMEAAVRLRLAIRQEPERQDLRDKLQEIHDKQDILTNWIRDIENEKS